MSSVGDSTQNQNIISYHNISSSQSVPGATSNVSNSKKKTITIGKINIDLDRLRLDISNRAENVREQLKTLTPEEVFRVFDYDDSGLITYEEFRRLLPFLGITVNDAKAYRFFRLCDLDDSGQIDVDEFKVIMYLCDPTSGNQVGYIPKRYTTPLDAFDLFDEDNSCDLDEDEFAYAMEYLGVKLSDSMIEKLFHESDSNKSGKIQYESFRDAFVKVCDVKSELEERGIDVSLFTNKLRMQQILRTVILEEDTREKNAMSEARKYKEWLSATRDKRILLDRAKYRADYELRSALDLSGQVYVFGEGYNKQFANPLPNKLKSSCYTFQYYDKIEEIWRNRVCPQQVINKYALIRRADLEERQREYDRRKRREEYIDEDLYLERSVLDPYIEAIDSLFRNVNTAVNCSVLYGRRVFQTALSENVAFALSDNGNLFTWGGNDYSWNEIQADSLYQSKWRGDTTPRSQLLLGTTEKKLQMHDSISSSFASDNNRKADVIILITKYYNIFEPPPDFETRMQFLEKQLLGKVSYDDVKFSLSCRGTKVDTGTKYQLMERLYDDILLEKKLLGEKAHNAIKELEQQVASLIKRKRDRMAKKILSQIETLWRPLLEVRKEYFEAKKEREQKIGDTYEERIENDYQLWRKKISEQGNQGIVLSGITPRAGGFATPRSDYRIHSISAGSMHASLIDKSGQLYSWGLGGSGRLGLNDNSDKFQPTLIDEIKHLQIHNVSCGHSHSAVITTDGDVYVWGACNTGKLGIGLISHPEKYYVHSPMKLSMPIPNLRAIKISCGYAHTAVIMDSGKLWVFGCGDGGRLGLGNELATVYSPTLVPSLLHEYVSTVSCGNGSTIISTKIDEIDSYEEDGLKVKRMIGGYVYIAGSSVVFGKDYHVFTKLDSIQDIPIKYVSAGYRHSALITYDGQLLCWGNNYSGACGVDPQISFVPEPTVVKSLYFKADNLARHSKIYQSSIFNDCLPIYAINGNKSGNGLTECSCTQEESHAWIEIDLGYNAIIETVKIWNRTDIPSFENNNLPIDYYTKRLFPMWIMISKKELDKQANEKSFQNNLLVTNTKQLFHENKRVSIWRCGNIEGRYIRVQLQGYNYLSIAEFEVFGRPKIVSGVGQVSHVCTGRDVTIATIQPCQSIDKIEEAYQRAVYCDTLNGEILRQYETFTSVYDEYGYNIEQKKKLSTKSIVNINPIPQYMTDCLICKSLCQLCEICKLYEVCGQEIKQYKDIAKKSKMKMHLNQLAEYLLSDSRITNQQDENGISQINESGNNT